MEKIHVFKDCLKRLSCNWSWAENSAIYPIQQAKCRYLFLYWWNTGSSLELRERTTAEWYKGGVQVEIKDPIQQKNFEETWIQINEQSHK